jgi:threonylcarbamoyladenosine tRNA methylthiotransferase MtaB
MHLEEKTVAFETLGCKLNFSETSSMRREFIQAGYLEKNFDDVADIYIINTCSVTLDANSTCRKTVRRARKTNPNAFIAVVGCYAQLKPDEIAQIKGVDVVLGAKEKFELLHLFDDFIKQEKTIIHRSDINEAAEFHHAFSSDDRTRAFLKVQDGCNYKCSFCTIPLARGISRSPSIESVILHAQKLIDEGFKEIILTGVNTGDFGYGREDNFFDLLNELHVLPGIQRLRVSSIEPNLLSTDIIDLVADSETLQPHFHMPLQSGSDTVLKLMRRRYDAGLYASRVAYIKSKIPDACIGVDVITGHPGETESYFLESVSFIESLDVSYLHVFTYSERPDTHALALRPIIEKSERKNRTHHYRMLSGKKRRSFDLSHLNSTREVLFESTPKNDVLLGWTDNYIRVAIPYTQGLENRIVPLKLSNYTSDGYYLEQISSEIIEELCTIDSLINL